MYQNGSNYQQLPYSPANDPVVAQDCAIRQNSVQEAWEKENIKNQGVKERERTKLEYKLRADEIKKRGQHQELTSYQIVNLDGKITYIRCVYGNPVGVALFEGIIKEVRQIVTESTFVLGYQFLVKTNGNECWTDVMPTKYLNDFDNIVGFLERYMIFHRPKESKKMMLDYLKGYLRGIICEKVEIPYYTGWFKTINCLDSSRKTVNCYQYIFHGQVEDQYESVLIQRSKLDYQKKTVEDTIADVLSLFCSLGDIENAGILFLYRLSSIFRYFLNYPVFEKKLFLVGDREQIYGISDYLKILRAFDTELIGISKTKDFENRLMCTPDDCALIMLDACSAYSRNKAIEIVRNGIFEERIGPQIRKTVPVFLSSKLLKETDADAFLIIDLEDLIIDYSSEHVRQVLATFDKYIFDLIHKSGEYWPDKLKRAFKIRVENGQKQRNKMVRMTAVFKTIARIICDITLEANVSQEVQKNMELLATAGITKISCLNTGFGDPKVAFINTIKAAAKRQAFSFYSRSDVPDGVDCLGNVYYDAQYYYFPQQLMKDKVLCRIDSGSRLNLLRELKDNGILHCHDTKSNGYVISIKIMTISGIKKGVSVYAISRSVFESAYGIKLYERG